MKFSAKAQIEVIGLAIIVVMVVIVMLFFFIRPANNSVDKNDEISSGVSQSFLVSFLQSPTGCGPDISTLLKNCYNGDDICGGSCDYAETIVKSRLDEYFAEKSIPYYFSAEKGNLKKIMLKSEDGSCSENSEKTGTGILAVPDKTSSIFVELGTCKLR